MDGSGDNLVNLTISQDPGSILFINEGRVVKVPEYPEPSGNNNNFEEEGHRYMPQRPQRSSRESDLRFCKRESQGGHSSAATCDDPLDARIIVPKHNTSERRKFVSFPIDQPTCPISRESLRWSQMPNQVPRLLTRRLHDGISENDESDGARMTQEQRRRKYAQSASRVIDNDLEQEYLDKYGGRLRTSFSNNVVFVEMIS
jgi:hypothetical protein